MLVLTRKSGESVLIGEDVVVTILEVRGDNSVRIGIEAPRDRRIQRAEIVARVTEANREASTAAEVSPESLARLLTGH
jgi:carbon storage regulator